MKNLPLFRRVRLGSTLRAASLALVLPVVAQSQVGVALTPELDRIAGDSRQGLVPYHFEGIVLALDGSPAEGAVVVSSAGGEAVTDRDGRYRLEVRAPRGTERARLTAVGRSGGQQIASRTVSLVATSASAWVGPLQLATASTCTPGWLPTFGGGPGADNNVRTLAVFDDGSGSALFAGGNFKTVGGQQAYGIAKWDGVQWTSLGGSQGTTISDFIVFDDGSGPALFAGGAFTSVGGIPANNVAKWNGTSWSALASGTNARVDGLAVFDDGGGAALHVSGIFTTAGGASANHIARWNGTTWSALGTGMDGGTVSCMAVFDDGGGADLYVGGTFSDAGGQVTNRIARWDGTSWSGVAGGVTGNSVSALTVFDDGTGPALFVAGNFTDAGGVPASHIAKWNGTTWSPLGVGLDERAMTLEVFDDGGGPELYVGGVFLFAGATTAVYIAKWDGTNWAALNTSASAQLEGQLVLDLEVYDDGSGPTLFAGGDFDDASETPANNIAKWDGTNWQTLGDGPNGDVTSLAVFDDGTGPALYAGGFHTVADGVDTNRLAKWNGTSWTPLGTGMDDGVLALTVFDDGNGPALYAGGYFTTAGGAATNYVARWDGTSWAPLGTGLSGAVFSRTVVHTLAVFDDGNGPALFAGGDFTTAGGVAASCIARWDGSVWTPLASGTNNVVFALEVFDDGSGEALYVGGKFQSAGGAPASRIAEWNGTAWAALGSGMNFDVLAFTLFDDGLGPALFVAGNFTNAGGVSAPRVAKWDGSSFAPLAVGTNSIVRALATFDDGTGEALYAGGSFANASGQSARRIARWDGSDWTALGAGLNRDVHALAVFDDGGGSALYVGGTFSSAVESGDSYLAKWGCPPSPYSAFCQGDGGDQMGCTNCPCGNEALPGSAGGCLNSSSSSARLRASGTPSAATDTMRFELSGGNPGSFALLSSGASRAPANAANPCFGLDSGLPFSGFDGLRCVVQNFLRHGTRPIDGAGDAGQTTNGWGPPSGPAGGLIAQGGFVAGQTRHYQAIYRENPALGCGTGLNTSQGISVTFEP